MTTEELFERLENIGRGTVCDVMRARVRATGQVVAMKLVDLAESEDDPALAPIIEEMKGLSRIEHPHLVRYLECHVAESQIVIVQELMGAGSVSDLIRANSSTTPRLSEAEIAYLLTQALQGIAYLHEHDIPHGGIKASNILVSETGAEVKMTDFGIWEQLQYQMTKRDTFMNSPFWLAPEIIAQEEDVPVSLAADIWAVGITAIEMALGQPPHFNTNPMKAVMTIPRSPPPTLPADTEQCRFSQEFRDFIALCLQKEAAKRPTVVEVMQHPFFKSHASDTVDVLKETLTRSLALQKQTIAAANASDAAATSSLAPPAATSSSSSSTTTTTSPPITSSSPSLPAKPTGPSALQTLIYPTLSKLLQQTQKDPDTVASLAKLKSAFDSLEKAKPGITHTFVSVSIDALKAFTQPK